MPNPRRRERLASVIEQVVSELLQRELKDPRLAGLTSVTRVEVSADARVAKIYVSVMGSEAERLGTMRALEHATGFVRTKLGEELTIRHVPSITFVLDRSIEQGDRVLALINRMASEQRAAQGPAAPAEAGEASQAPAERGADD
ncbi:MAG TPA: 30S ribosome-binding factor RbfA [Chloroflexota bacterium]|jgi:ribosome-binding factor A|nr:30S ribosome-binding factor RbfA [Chloroflexota bacterium]